MTGISEQAHFLTPDTLLSNQGRRTSPEASFSPGSCLPIRNGVRTQMQIGLWSMTFLGIVHGKATRPAPRVSQTTCVCTPFFPAPPMANSSPTSDAITRTVRASLKLATTSTEQLSLTQLLTLSVELQKASATVNAKIQSRLDATPGVFSANVLRSTATQLCLQDVPRLLSK